MNMRIPSNHNAHQTAQTTQTNHAAPATVAKNAAPAANVAAQETLGQQIGDFFDAAKTATVNTARVVGHTAMGAVTGGVGSAILGSAAMALLNVSPFAPGAMDGMQSFVIGSAYVGAALFGLCEIDTICGEPKKDANKANKAE